MNGGSNGVIRINLCYGIAEKRWPKWDPILVIRPIAAHNDVVNVTRRR